MNAHNLCRITATTSECSAAAYPVYTLGTVVLCMHCARSSRMSCKWKQATVCPSCWIFNKLWNKWLSSFSPLRTKLPVEEGKQVGKAPWKGSLREKSSEAQNWSRQRELPYLHSWTAALCHNCPDRYFYILYFSFPCYCATCRGLIINFYYKNICLHSMEPILTSTHIKFCRIYIFTGKPPEISFVSRSLFSFFITR